MLTAKWRTAVFHGPKRGVASVNLTISDVRDQKLQHCVIPLHGDPLLESIWDAIITNTQQSIVFFDRYSATFHHTSVNLAGEIESQGEIRSQEISGFSYIRDVAETGRSGRAREHHGEVVLWRRLVEASTGIWKIVRICYKTDKQQLEIKENRIKYNGTFPHADTSRIGFFWWKDVAYFLHDPASDQPTALSLGRQDSKAVAMIPSQLITAKIQEIGAKYIPYGRTNILGDETFFILVCRGYYLAWCFDKNITMENDIAEYRTVLEEE